MNLSILFLIGLTISTALGIDVILYENQTAKSSSRLSFNSYPNWMKDVSNSKSLAELSLPGTHDTMSLFGGSAVETQKETLENQLLYGIRVLDIRCRHIQNNCAIHHGIVFQKAFLHNVLTTVTKHLTTYPTEVVLMRIKDECPGDKCKPGDGNTRSLADTVAAIISRYLPFIWQGGTRIPTVGEVRGRIVILDDLAGGRFGPIWGSLRIQDEYQVYAHTLSKKVTLVLNHMEYANSDKYSLNLYVNFLSGSGGLTIKDIASYVNIRFIEHLRVYTLNYMNKIGAIMMDYPTAEQLSQIIDINFHAVSSHVWLYENSSQGGQRKVFSLRRNTCIILGAWDNRASSLNTLGKYKINI